MGCSSFGFDISVQLPVLGVMHRGPILLRFDLFFEVLLCFPAL